MKGLWKAKLDFIDGGKHSYSQRRKKTSKNQHLKDNIIHYGKSRFNQQNRYGMVDFVRLRVLVDLNSVLNSYTSMGSFEDLINTEETLDLVLREGFSKEKLIKAIESNSKYCFKGNSYRKTINSKITILNITELEKFSKLDLLESNYEYIDNFDFSKLNNSRFVWKKRYSSLLSDKWQKVLRNKRERRKVKRAKYNDEIREFYDDKYDIEFFYEYVIEDDGDWDNLDYYTDWNNDADLRELAESLDNINDYDDFSYDDFSEDY